jgi:hypothetical protein
MTRLRPMRGGARTRVPPWIPILRRARCNPWACEGLAERWLCPALGSGQRPQDGKRRKGSAAGSSRTGATSAGPGDPRKAVFLRVADLPVLPLPGSFGEATLRVLPGSRVVDEAVVTIVGVLRLRMAPGGGRFPPTVALGTSPDIITALVILTIGLRGRRRHAAGRVGECDPFRNTPRSLDGKVSRRE